MGGIGGSWRAVGLVCIGTTRVGSPCNSWTSSLPAALFSTRLNRRRHPIAERRCGGLGCERPGRNALLALLRGVAQQAWGTTVYCLAYWCHLCWHAAPRVLIMPPSLSLGAPLLLIRGRALVGARARIDLLCAVCWPVGPRARRHHRCYSGTIFCKCGTAAFFADVFWQATLRGSS